MKTSNHCGLRHKVMDNTVSIWLVSLPKSEWCITVAVDVIRERVTTDGSFNINAIMRRYAIELDDAATMRWIANSPNESVRERRYDIWTNDIHRGRLSAGNAHVIDGIARILLDVIGQS